MENRIITIKNGIVSIPNGVRMSIAEIADLFGIYYRTAKRHIRSIEESGVIGGGYLMNCMVEGQKVCPEYYGLDMIISVAFRVQSAKAEVFRRYIMRKAVKMDLSQTILIHFKDAVWN